jgi:hypothetical protein
MTIEEFRAADPASLTGPLLAMWWQGRGEWERAHEVAQEIESADGAWVHAHLHRVEGDRMNAGYWYRRAGRPMPADDLGAEWERMVGEMLQRRR